MPVRGVRGAITVEANTKVEILSATRELLEEIIARNELNDFSEVVSAIFTTTTDLTAAFPAEAARELGMGSVPLLCASEIEVPGALPLVIRILLHLNSDKHQSEMNHVYLRDAQKLRKDISNAQ
ncbi:chorismate mutase [Thalassoglobus polymorphus]|uniref:chorismate mutase n=1 Tax=Thalassoglobus polymorphus TaxID=2527994 RepID=A0A517QMC7_9PLAN|nr:chorismate mutase [Thalassoglobus polymorphus]QDT32761.1 Chorismate mutase AroH [Thalassoglobus polymorphus]